MIHMQEERGMINFSQMKNHNKNNMKTDPKKILGYMLESDQEEDYNNSATNFPMWDKSPSRSSISSTRLSFETSTSLLSISPWSSLVRASSGSYTGLMGSLVREEGHIYSLATSGDLLYTGSDSKNIRIWKNQKEFSGFKASSGLVKAIIIAEGKIFTGHQDGKIRVWEMSGNGVHKKIGMLPTLKAKFKSSLKPSNYIEVKKNRNAIWIKHVDVISFLCLSEDKSLLYSASWDKTIKVWRLSDSKCLESINAHDDAVNSVVAGFDGLVFTGSADGSVKVWRREKQGKGTKHFFSQTLLKQECAITSLSVDDSGYVLYCGSSDGLVYFWERYTFLSYGGVLRGHKLAVLCLITTGNLVFSGSADKNICVWKRDRGGEHICLSVLCGHNGPVKCLAVEEEKGNHYIVYSGSLDKSVKIWRVFGDGINAIQTPPDPLSGQVENDHVDEMDTSLSPPPRHVKNYNARHRFPSFQGYEHEAKMQSPSCLPPRPVENYTMSYKIPSFRSYENADEMHIPQKAPPQQYHHNPTQKFTWGQKHPTQGSRKMHRSTSTKQ